MKATELRIGNYISYRTEKTTLVSSLGSDFETVNTYNGLLCGSDDLDEYIPILLTKEWLIKFGFYQDEKNVYMCLNIVLLRLRISYGTVTLIQSGESIRVPEIIYVHQLQNLYFALTGKELKQI